MLQLEDEDGIEMTGDVINMAAAPATARALIVCDGVLYHTGLHTLTSALKRAPNLNPLVKCQKIDIPDTGKVTLVQASLQNDTLSISV